jgi:hypothetical protein
MAYESLGEWMVAPLKMIAAFSFIRVNTFTYFYKVQVTVVASPPFGDTEIDYPRNTLPLAVKCLEGMKSWAHFQI